MSTRKIQKPQKSKNKYFGKAKTTSKRRSNTDKRHAEDLLQEQCIKWMANTYPGVLYCGNHAGTCASSIMEALWAKRRGYIPGAPDINVCQPAGPFHGMFIEMKTPSGKLRANQKDYLDRLRRRGYFTCVCRTFDGFKTVVTKYMSLRKKEKKKEKNKK